MGWDLHWLYILAHFSLYYHLFFEEIGMHWCMLYAKWKSCDQLHKAWYMVFVLPKLWNLLMALQMIDLEKAWL